MTGKHLILGVAAVWGLSACKTLSRGVMSHDPLSPAEHVVLGDSYWAQSERNSAIQQYEIALAEDRGNVPALMALGNAAFEGKDWKKARAYFRRALKVAPDNAGVINNLAMADLAEEKPLDDARRRLEKKLPTAGPVAPYLLDTLANIAIREGREGDARRALEEAQARAPQNDPDFAKRLAETRGKL